MAFSDNITMIGLSAIVFYVIVQILTFYGVGAEVYGYYICFYILMMLFVVTLPKPTNYLENISAS
jgi:hypothetical protein